MTFSNITTGIIRHLNLWISTLWWNSAIARTDAAPVSIYVCKAFNVDSSDVMVTRHLSCHILSGVVSPLILFQIADSDIGLVGSSHGISYPFGLYRFSGWRVSYTIPKSATFQLSFVSRPGVTSRAFILDGNQELQTFYHRRDWGKPRKGDTRAGLNTTSAARDEYTSQAWRFTET